MNARKALFWLHLVIGVVAGGVILVMAVSGCMIAYQRQIIALAERGVATVTPPPSGAVPLRPEAIAEKVATALPQSQPTGFTLRRDPASSVTVNLGRERTLFVDPYNGTVLGEGSWMRGFLHDVEHLHRDLALGQPGRAITGACTLAFLVLLLSGLFLWLPRTWTRKGVRAIAVPSLKLKGRARDWNWHNALGIWSALPLLIAIVTGVVMSYPWANNLLYTMTGNQPPPPRTAPQPKGEGARREPARFDFRGFNERWTQAEQQVPGWQSISARLPESAGGPLTFLIDEGDGTRPDTRSQLLLDPKSGAVRRWEPFSSHNLGRQLRMWTRPVHTGEALGLAGQTLAASATVGACILVWTGFALSWRRFRRRQSGTQAREEPIAAPGDIPLAELGANASPLTHHSTIA